MEAKLTSLAPVVVIALGPPFHFCQEQSAGAKCRVGKFEKSPRSETFMFGVCGLDWDEWMDVVDLSISGLLSIVADVSISPSDDGSHSPSLHPFEDPISMQFGTDNIQQPK